MLFRLCKVENFLSQRKTMTFVAFLADTHLHPVFTLHSINQSPFWFQGHFTHQREDGERVSNLILFKVP